MRRLWTGRETVAVWLVGDLMLLGVLTVQDRLSGQQPVAYTEIGELFARGNPTPSV
jgi:hypothetical protein